MNRQEPGRYVENARAQEEQAPSEAALIYSAGRLRSPAFASEKLRRIHGQELHTAEEPKPHAATKGRLAAEEPCRLASR